MGLVPPKAGFLEGLRELCDQHGALLIFDEVITGFRVSFGGAQQRFGITPDLTTLGKIIGGGLPVGAYGGKREIMQRIAPCGEVYQRVRSRVTRWPWPQASPPSTFCPAVTTRGSKPVSPPS